MTPKVILVLPDAYRMLERAMMKIRSAKRKAPLDYRPDPERLFAEIEAANVRISIWKATQKFGPINHRSQGGNG